MALLRIRQVKALKSFALELRLADGSVIERDVASLLMGPIFEQLQAYRAWLQAERAEAGTVALEPIVVARMHSRHRWRLRTGEGTMRRWAIGHHGRRLGRRVR
jgi:hypothetical protein